MIYNREGILELANFQYEQIGYADICFISRIMSVPEPLVEEVITSMRFIKSDIKNRFIKY